MAHLAGMFLYYSVSCNWQTRTRQQQQAGSTVTKTKINKGHPFFPLLLLQFRFASLSDAILILVGCLAAAAGGCTFPVMVVLYGDLANTFVAAQISGGSTNDSVAGAALNDLGAAFAGDIGYYAAGTAILGLANLASAYVFVTCLNLAAAAQVHRIRSLFLRAVLRQEIGWHDTHRTGDFAVRMTE